MPLSNEQKIMFAEKDVKVIKKEARIVLRILSDNKVEIVENKNWRMNLLAVTGYSWGFGKGWDEALLLEIGISRSRPYKPMERLNKKQGESKEIPQRKKYFSLSLYQYKLVAPIIFAKIEGIAYDRVVSWKRSDFSGLPFKIKKRRLYYSRKYRKVFEPRPYFQPVKTGPRFSVSPRDDFLIRDIYWRDMQLNSKGLLNFIDMRVKDQTKYYKGRKSFLKLKDIQKIKSDLQSSLLPRYIIIEVIRCLKEEKRNLFWPYFVEMINWDGAETKERKLARLAESGIADSEPKRRLGGIKLRVTTGLDRGKDHIVFEVYPRQK